jgi:hypothetical protein
MKPPVAEDLGNCENFEAREIVSFSGWLRNRFGGGRKKKVTELPAQLLWMADAPLFIDAKQVEAFYDAVLQPGYEEIGKSLNLSDSTEWTFGGKISAGAAFPGLANFGAGLGGSRTKESGKEEGTTWKRISNPYRHLLALVLRYAVNDDLRPRLVFADGQGSKNASEDPVDLKDESFVGDSPRAMIMLDLPPGTKFIPAALELQDGETVAVYKKLADRLEEKATRPLPEFKSESDPASAQARVDYWNWFLEFYDRQTALEVVEDAVKGGAIAWIAYRVPLYGHFVHLHLAGRGQYDTGTFGYQLLARGSRHGVRIVGMLKSEPDINVLAIFER